jgi:hypothetical protein
MDEVVAEEVTNEGGLDVAVEERGLFQPRTAPRAGRHRHRRERVFKVGGAAGKTDRIGS